MRRARIVAKTYNPTKMFDVYIDIMKIDTARIIAEMLSYAPNLIMLSVQISEDIPDDATEAYDVNWFKTAWRYTPARGWQSM